MHTSTAIRRRATVAAALTLLLVAARRPSQPRQPAEPRHSAFVTVVARNWSAWDANHDNTLSADEVDRVVLDPKVKGEDAAAAATLKAAMRSKKLEVPPLTRAYFEQYDATATGPKPSDEDAARATVDLDKSAGKTPKWDTLFAASKHRIKAADAATASWPGTDALGRMRQGPMGDCFFVAVVGAAVNRDPGIVKQLLSSVSPGAVKATFPGNEPAFSLTLTDAERALSGSTGGQGDWLALLEQAYGRYRAKRTGKATDTESTEGTDAICHGGSAGPVIAALTGHGSHYIGLPNNLDKRKAAADKLLPKVRTLIADGLHDRRLVVASVGADPNAKPDAPKSPKDADAKTDEPKDPADEASSATLPNPPNITHGHMYAIVGFDATSDVVTIWNPHGQTFHPKGPDGLANGYTTEHGTFKLPLSEMYQFFGGVSCELTTPPAPPRSSLGNHRKGK